VLQTIRPSASPFLKWPGGKRWAAAWIRETARFTGAYIEPFLGGGAVFFSLAPRRAVLSDLNADLINAYRIVRDQPEALVDEIQTYDVSESDYYRIRAARPDEPLQRAARFLYLNRTAFAGLYRENRRGEFNVPFGRDRRPDALWRDNLIASASRALQGVELAACDFAVSLRRAGPGDLVYCDPTYTVMQHATGFRRYNERTFSWSDQERLASEAGSARDRGARILVSNAFHPSVRALYPTAQVFELARRSAIARDPANRGSITEYLFVLSPT
jgi:DNA adenine methylase